MDNATAIIAGKVFTGNEWLHDVAIISQDGIVKEIVSAAGYNGKVTQHLSQGIIVPAFIDIQIYGAYGRLFSEYPDVQSLEKLVQYCAEGGAAYCIPTLATNSLEVFYKCIDAVRKYWSLGGSGILGLHLEGPWINPDKRGAHVVEFIHPPEIDEVKRLLDYGKDVIKMITLAPEVCPDEVLEYIRSQGIIISAGHSNITFSDAKKSFKKGISTVTHLYNAMSALQHRAPGLVGAAFEDDEVFASIIPDGYHVDFAAVSIALEAMTGRLFVITDAVTQACSGPYQHTLAGDKYEASGTLSGSALNMHKAFMNLLRHTSATPEQALQMCSAIPAKVMRLEEKIGTIAPGHECRLLHLDDSYNFIGLIQ